ncbi:MAG: regulator of cell morphogenesis and NO signaling [Cyclobacteriaceae bacterium]|jgi:regulator of cell morphogenesis and NO signaling
MNLSEQTDFLNQLLGRRFKDPTSNRINEPCIKDDFYVDLLSAFHNPDQFQAANFRSYSLPSILVYLRKTHELYVNKNIGEIMMAIKSLTDNNTIFLKLQTSLHLFFKDFRTHLVTHIEEEERNFFPYIEALLIAENRNKLSFDWTKKVKLIDFLLDHNDNLERDLESLVKALKNKAASHKDSFAFQMLVNRLSIFELDLRIHAKIEEKVLMPRALLLEKKVLNTPGLRIDTGLQIQ